MRGAITLISCMGPERISEYSLDTWQHCRRAISHQSAPYPITHPSPWVWGASSLDHRPAAAT